ncbi:hypothetical protein FB451DRAFT_1305494 [Mycena latifolia]|nr:hypothetical protein FB451DRAFT_1305494 [Mycena latifolia]
MPKAKKAKPKKERMAEAKAKRDRREWALIKDFESKRAREAAVQRVQDALRDAVTVRGFEGVNYNDDEPADDDDEPADPAPTPEVPTHAIDGSLSPEESDAPDESDGEGLVVPRSKRPQRTTRPGLAGVFRPSRGRVVDSDDECDYNPNHRRDARLLQLAERADSDESVRAMVRDDLHRLLKYSDFYDDPNAGSHVDAIEKAVDKYESGGKLCRQEYDEIMTAAPVVGSIIRVPRHPRRPPPTISRSPHVASVEESLWTEILNIGGRAFTTGPFLERLGSFAKTLKRDIYVHPKALFHVSGEAKRGATQAKWGQFNAYGTAGGFWKKRPDQCEVSLALAVAWTKPPPSASWAEFRDAEFHAILFALIHAPPGPGSMSAGKALLIGDVNNEDDDLLPRVKTLLANAPTNRFVNLPRTEINNRGVCLTLALEWMVELVVRGIRYKRREDGTVVQVTGFRPYS